MLSTTVEGRKCNSSLGVMLMHTTYYGGALTPIPENKLHRIFGDFKPEYL
jgi:hypothetical protein